MKNSNTITIVGGCGHIGLPLSILLAIKGFNVIAYDKNKSTIDKVKNNKMPFMESGGDKHLSKALKTGRLFFTDHLVNKMKDGNFIITIGTPVDEFLNPSTSTFKKCIDELKPYISNNKLVILRSTVSPGVTDWLSDYLNNGNKKILVSFCLERVVQGKTFEEISKIPQIIAGTTKKANILSSKIFKKLTNKIIYCSPKEAELSKLYSNAFRYIQFAISNQFYMLADEYGFDFHKIRKLMTESYPRAQSLPGSGFAAGPCLFKDTMQLLSYTQNNFTLGFNAMLVNEGLVLYIVNKINKKYNLKNKSIALLGMSFKADIDDTRSSLSFKLKKTLSTITKKIYCNEPNIKNDKNLISLNEALKKDIIIICAPHKEYKKINFPKKKIVIDVWGITTQK